jgi:hypothetical protein
MASIIEEESTSEKSKKISSCHPEEAESPAKRVTPDEGSLHFAGASGAAGELQRSFGAKNAPQDDNVGWMTQRSYFICAHNSVATIVYLRCIIMRRFRVGRPRSAQIRCGHFTGCPLRSRKRPCRRELLPRSWSAPRREKFFVQRDARRPLRHINDLHQASTTCTNSQQLTKSAANRVVILRKRSRSRRE